LSDEFLAPPILLIAYLLQFINYSVQPKQLPRVLISSLFPYSV